MVTFPYNTTDFAFTLNDVYIGFSTTTANTYFDLTVTISYYNFFSADVKTEVLEYKIPLFNQAQQYNIGRKIHRYLANPPVYANTYGFQYKTASVSIEATEISIADGTTIGTETLEDIKFIAGTKPTLLDNNCALLSANTTFERVTKDGLFIVNFLLPVGNHVLKIQKNNLEVDSIEIEATETDNVYAKKIVISEYNGQKGDVFTVFIEGTIINKSFVIFPDKTKSNQLLFVDNFKLLRSLECNGSFSFPNEYDQITHSYKQNLVEILQIVATEKVNKLKLNTGYLLKTDTETIDALLDSKTVYLVKNNSTVLEMVPIAKKETAEDSDQALYQYDLEFQINKKNA